MELPEAVYRVSIKAVVVEDTRLLLVQESDGRWTLPGGGIDHGESIKDCLMRELTEEIGAKPSDIFSEPIYAHPYMGKAWRFLIYYEVNLESNIFTNNQRESVNIAYVHPDNFKTLTIHSESKEFIEQYIKQKLD